MAKSASASKNAPSSLLEQAFSLYEQGDLVLARRAARAVKDGPTSADEASARKLAAQLSTPEKKVEGARAAAEDLIERTRPPPKAYLFAGVGIAVIVLLVALAVSRYAG